MIWLHPFSTSHRNWVALTVDPIPGLTSFPLMIWIRDSKRVQKQWVALMKRGSYSQNLLLSKSMIM